MAKVELAVTVVSNLDRYFAAVAQLSKFLQTKPAATSPKALNNWGIKVARLKQACRIWAAAVNEEAGLS